MEGKSGESLLDWLKFICETGGGTVVRSSGDGRRDVRRVRRKKKMSSRYRSRPFRGETEEKKKGKLYVISTPVTRSTDGVLLLRLSRAIFARPIQRLLSIRDSIDIERGAACVYI